MNTPSAMYRRQRRADRSDLAFVELGGRRHYLGPYGTDASHERLPRMVAEWAANQGNTAEAVQDITVVELVARFIAHATTCYSAAEVRNWCTTLRALRGDLPPNVVPLFMLVGPSPPAQRRAERSRL